MLAFLQDIFGPSYRSTVIALATLLLGLVLFLLGWLTGEVSLKVLGLGMVPTAALGFVTRDNQASVETHNESLAKIANAEHKASEKHVELTAVINKGEADHQASAEKLAEVVAIVREVPIIAAETAAAVVQEKLKQ
jgi:uncharacterized membrane protein YiaA